jgi:hypothetical protein
MKLGTDVPGINTEGVFFVLEDQHEIAKRVTEYDADAALVVNKLDEHKLGIARFVRDQKWAPCGAWVIAFWCNDQETGKPLSHEPDARVLQLMMKFDTHRRADPRRDRHRVRTVLAMREARRLMELRDRAGAMAEQTVHRWQQARGLKHKIFVPATVNDRAAA